MNKAPFLSSLIQKFAFQRDYISLWVFIYSEEVRYSVLQFMEECQSDAVWLFFVSEVPVLSSLEDGTKEIKETNKGTFSLKE